MQCILLRCTSYLYIFSKQTTRSTKFKNKLQFSRPSLKLETIVEKEAENPIIKLNNHFRIQRVLNIKTCSKDLKRVSLLWFNEHRESFLPKAQNFQPFFFPGLLSCRKLQIRGQIKSALKRETGDWIITRANY